MSKSHFGRVSPDRDSPIQLNLILIWVVLFLKNHTESSCALFWKQKETEKKILCIDNKPAWFYKLTGRFSFCLVNNI